MRAFIFIDARGKRIESLTYGRLQIDAPRWQVTWGGARVRLSRAPMMLVYQLANRPGVIRSREDLLSAIARATTDNDRAIDSCVKKARQAFRAVDDAFDQIEVIYGEGYRWRLE